MLRHNRGNKDLKCIILLLKELTISGREKHSAMEMHTAFIDPGRGRSSESPSPTMSSQKRPVHTVMTSIKQLDQEMCYSCFMVVTEAQKGVKM
jgi:hypothetical protein